MWDVGGAEHGAGVNPPPSCVSQAGPPGHLRGTVGTGLFVTETVILRGSGWPAQISDAPRSKEASKVPGQPALRVECQGPTSCWRWRLLGTRPVSKCRARLATGRQQNPSQRIRKELTSGTQLHTKTCCDPRVGLSADPWPVVPT